MEKTFGFIGAGNMGGAVAISACRALGAARVIVFDPDLAKTSALSAETGCSVASNLDDLVARADFIVLCVKPNMIDSVIETISPAIAAAGGEKSIASIAAGVSISAIAEALAKGGLRLPIVRLLPNTPMTVGKGMTVLACCPGVSDEDKALICQALSAGGEVLELEEKLIDAATPVFSCSPAFGYMFIDALADGGVMAGLPRAQAICLAAQSLYGAAAMVLESGKHPAQLKDEVCSPGGSTIVGVEELEKKSFRAAVASAVFEAYKKTLTLSGK